MTPLRALAGDTAAALQRPLDDLNTGWRVELRTSDVSSHVKQRQRDRLPTVLVTTPESLSLLLSYPQGRQRFASLQCVVADEWHELMGSKRGVQAELCLARLRRWLPKLRIWGVSATLGNLEQACDVLLGSGPQRTGARLIRGPAGKRIEVVPLIPDTIERFPWAGHMGVHLVGQVVEAIERARSTLLFTNTRSQAERWFQALLKARPDWLGRTAIHHGSVDRAIRGRVEQMLREGRLKAVVCTSSLDLGVDFEPVEQVLQLGSPKGIGRIMQRAGRSGHQPGAVSRVYGISTHALELIEFSAAAEAVEAGDVEPRLPLRNSLDVLVQHLVTLAAGDGFRPDELLDEVRTTHAFETLSSAQWSWAMDFVRRGGASLTAYPEYAKVVEDDGVWRVASPRIARMHRMMIGTITSEAMVSLEYRSGRRVGMVEEGFIGRLRAGDRFLFAGRVLELIRVRDMVAQVRPARSRVGVIPRWMGARFPLSTHLAAAVRRRLEQARDGVYADAAMEAVRPLLELQKRLSRIPARDELLIERSDSRDGHHAFLYPFLGRLVHEGLGALLAWRLTRDRQLTVIVNGNDYGLELLCPDALELDEAAWRDLLAPAELLDDLLGALGQTQLPRRQFREIARIAGLVFSGPGVYRKSARQLQASSDLFYDVFGEHDPQNLLLDQARREVLEQQLEFTRLQDALETLQRQTIRLVDVERFSPLGFPIWASRLREQYVSTEQWSQRIERMARELEAQVDPRPARTRRRRT